MINRWTLKLENFGRIDNAKIKISPFMMFVGDNNTGKSYTLELLWSIFTNLDQLISDIEEEEQFRDIASRIVSKAKMDEESDSYFIKVDNLIQSQLIQVFNTLLHKKKEWLVEETFNHKMNIGHLSIERDDYFDFEIKVSNSKKNKTQLMKVEDKEENIIVHMDILIHKLLIKNEVEENYLAKAMSFKSKEEIIEEHIIKNFLKIIIKTLIYRDYSEEPIYFPASRTGFMHTYQFILGNERRALRNQLAHNTLLPDDEELVYLTDQLRFNDHNMGSKLRLTAPVYSYLEKLADIFIDESQREKYKEEINFLNQHIFRGQIDIDEARNYKFIPIDGKDSLPLHVTSSLVAEIAPISIFLSSQYKSKLFMIEESESHLHINKQLQLARLFFRLLNKNKSIWLTTHSDSFAQQINNLLTLSNHECKERLFKELNYEEVDTLKDTSVATCYQFKSENGKSTIKSIELGDYGFIIPTFNDSLLELLDQTSKIQDMDECNE